jgi:hypothetical protein
MLDTGFHEPQMLGWVKIKDFVPFESKFERAAIEGHGFHVDFVEQLIGEATGTNLLSKVAQGHAINVDKVDKKIHAEIDEHILGYYDDSIGDLVKNVKAKKKTAKRKEKTVEPIVDINTLTDDVVAPEETDRVIITPTTFEQSKPEVLEDARLAEIEKQRLADIAALESEQTGDDIADDLTEEEQADQDAIDESVSEELDQYGEIVIDGAANIAAETPSELSEDEDNTVYDADGKVNPFDSVKSPDINDMTCG